MAYIGKQPVVGNFQVCDAISVVNGQAAYTMQVGSTNVEPENANHMLVSLNGVLQKPGSSFTISGATITFASNLATGDVIDFIILLGDTLNVGTPSDSTVTTAKLGDGAVTSAKLGSNAVDTQVLSLLNASGSAPVFGCRAWVNFDGDESTPSIRASGNVSSITDNGTGDYAVNFTTAMQDANYCTQVSINQSSGSYLRVGSFKTSGTYSTSAVQIICEENNAADVDRNKICVVVFR